MASKVNMSADAASSHSLNLLAAILSSDLLSKTQKSLYKEIFSHGSLTSRELGKMVTGAGTITSHLGKMAIRGVIVADGIKHDSDIGRSIASWRITGRLPNNKPTKRPVSADYPTAHELKVFSKHLAVLTAAAAQNGARISPAVRKVKTWLMSGAPCKHMTININNKKAR